jgi:predicted DNA-binding ribbon-helix-helix protein
MGSRRPLDVLSTEPIRQSAKPNMKTVTKHSIVLNDHKTSISLEIEFWQGLREIAEQEGMSTGELVAKIDRERNNRNLSSAIRVFVYSHFRAKHP